MTNALRYRLLWLGIGWAYVAFILFISLIPQPPKIGIEIEYFDKLVHFLAYAGAMTWFIQLYEKTSTRVYYALGFIAMGVGVEFLQELGGQRMFEYSDMLANSLGVLGALLLVKGMLARLLWQLERHLPQRS